MIQNQTTKGSQRKVYKSKRQVLKNSSNKTVTAKCKLQTKEARGTQAAAQVRHEDNTGPGTGEASNKKTGWKQDDNRHTNKEWRRNTGLTNDTQVYTEQERGEKTKTGNGKWNVTHDKQNKQTNKNPNHDTAKEVMFKLWLITFGWFKI